jgi:hypothetical protein
MNTNHFFLVDQAAPYTAGAQSDNGLLGSSETAIVPLHQDDVIPDGWESSTPYFRYWERNETAQCQNAVDSIVASALESDDVPRCLQCNGRCAHCPLDSENDDHGAVKA